MSKNTFEEAEDFLMHWGILGMKWGVRRYQNPDGSLTAAGKKRYGADDAKGSSGSKSSSKSSEAQPQEDSQPQVRANKPKPASEMTDDELRAFLNRIELERRYNAIVNPPPPQQEQKKKEMPETLKFMKDVFAESAKNVAKTVITAKLMELVGGNKKKDTSDKTDNIKKLFNDMNKENSDRFKKIEGLLESGNNNKNNNNNNNNNRANKQNEDQSQDNMMNQLTNYYAQQEAYRQAAQRQRQADAISQRQAYEANERAMREARAEQQRALKEAKINQRNYEKEKRDYEKGLKRYEREEKKRQNEENKKKAAASNRTIEERVANLNSRTIEQRVASLLGSKEIRDTKASSLPKEDYSVFDEELWKDLTSGW